MMCGSENEIFNGVAPLSKRRRADRPSGVTTPVAPFMSCDMSYMPPRYFYFTRAGHYVTITCLACLINGVRVRKNCEQIGLLRSHVGPLAALSMYMADTRQHVTHLKLRTSDGESQEADWKCSVIERSLQRLKK